MFFFSEIMKVAITNLKSLETEGLMVIDKSGIEHHFLATVSLIICDNLAAHEVSGFVESFSGLRACRFCMITKTDMQTCFNSDELVLRTPNMYDEQVRIVTENPNVGCTYGVKKNSPLNDLDHFHVCWNCPSDIAHDIFEGIGPELIKVTVEEFI